MIRVLDEQRSTAFYKTALDLTPADRIDFDTFTLVYLCNPETTFELELTVNKGRTEPYNLGDGYGHTAVVVESLDTEQKQMETAGVSPGATKQITTGVDSHDFSSCRNPDGYKIEVIERGGRFR